MPICLIFRSEYSLWRVRYQKKKIIQVFIYFSDEEIELNLCQFCDEIVPLNTKDLLMHGKTCEYASRLDKSYNYVCYRCSYHTRKADHMRDHIMRHTGEKPFQCYFCNYRVLRKQNLNTHIKINHTWEILSDLPCWKSYQNFYATRYANFF